MDQRSARPTTRATRSPATRTATGKGSPWPLYRAATVRRDSDPDADSKPDAEDKAGKKDDEDKEERGKDDLYTGDGDS